MPPREKTTARETPPYSVVYDSSLGRRGAGKCVISSSECNPDVLNKEDWGAAVCDGPFGTNKLHNPRADTCAPEGG